MRHAHRFGTLAAMVVLLQLATCTGNVIRSELACVSTYVLGEVPPVAQVRTERFLGKVSETRARCRGGQYAVDNMRGPWLDWPNFWATRDESSRVPLHLLSDARIIGPNAHGINGALVELELQRIELIKFNLFDNNKTYEAYLKGRGDDPGPIVKSWPEMRLADMDSHYQDVGGAAAQQICTGETIRFRTVNGICNDIYNPLMGSTGQLFARNVQFDTTFPDLGRTALTKNRHGDRLGLLKPDPQVISRKLFTRSQRQSDACRDGYGDGTGQADCDYKKAPFFNVLAAFWIQFMTHDWFSHLVDGHNEPTWMEVGCRMHKIDNVERPLGEEDIRRLGCRPGDRIDRAYIAEEAEPATFAHGDKTYLTRAPKTMRNNVTAWWDASQIYGYDADSEQRVKHDPNDYAKLLLESNGPGRDPGGYLPILSLKDVEKQDEWAGQEAVAFPDNWSIGLSFFHNVFAREHNAFVNAFRKQPGEADSGLRRPSKPDVPVPYNEVEPKELFEITRLVVSAEIAKIHTTEWTTQLLYGEPLYKGMNANWHGLLQGDSDVSEALKEVVRRLDDSDNPKNSNGLYAALAGGPGIFGLGNRVYEEPGLFSLLFGEKKDVWSLTNSDHVNGGVKHFGSPFNFPEEFITVYRLHPLVPDMIEYREWDGDPNVIKAKMPVAETFRKKATDAMHEKGLANWALSMGRQRLGLLTLQNHPRFLQNLKMGRLQSEKKQIDVAALDLIRDRERGIPRYNEFRRQYGLKQLTSFDDFVDQRLPMDPVAHREQERLVQLLRDVYGQHTCDASKIITDAQVNDDKSPINDCLGHPDGSPVDNVEDLDTVVGWLAEFRRPHGFAISETQFLVFVLNASRRLFSDRFFTSSFRKEFYTQFGVDWVNNNGPDVQMEKQPSNGHLDPVSPMKRVLLRALPELSAELDHVVNVFDPWGRDRGEYYSLQWKARPGAEHDQAFAQP
ncbi:MAG TPA: peroxidase family protein [Nitrospira sp.]|nr:peroxidase family protein [Nitrospira sp.]